MKDFFDKNMKQAIVASIIVMAIGFLIKSVWEIAINYSGNIYTSLINYYYLRASVTTGNELIEFGATSIIGIMYIIMGLLFIYIISDYSKRIKSLRDNREKNELEVSLSEISITEKKIEKKGIKRLRCEQFVNIICLCSIIFIAIYTYAFVYSPTKTKKVIDLAIIIITPYVEQKDIDMLKSEWIRMRTKEDYIKIETKINSIEINSIAKEK
jgi:hypothetical protein